MASKQYETRVARESLNRQIRIETFEKQIEVAKFEIESRQLPEQAPWQLKALCSTTIIDSEVFFHEGQKTSDKNILKATLAKKACAACTVSEQCLQYAIENNENTGIWGQATEDERKAMRRGAMRRRQ